jgi:hypothetical protein
MPPVRRSRVGDIRKSVEDGNGDGLTRGSWGHKTIMRMISDRLKNPTNKSQETQDTKYISSYALTILQSIPSTSSEVSPGCPV